MARMFWQRARTVTATTTESEKALTSESPRRSSSLPSSTDDEGIPPSRAETKAGTSAPVSLKTVAVVEKAAAPSSSSVSVTARAGSFSSDEAQVEGGGRPSPPIGSVCLGSDLTHEKIGWKKAAFVLIAETISLGVLSLPEAVSQLGLVLGGMLIFVFFVLTLSAGWMLYKLKLRYPQLSGFADAAEMVGGRVFFWLVESLNLLLLFFVMACHIILFGTMAETIADDGLWSCSVFFKVVGFVVCLLPSLLRTLKAQAPFSYLSCASIVTAVTICIISVGVTNPGHGVFSVIPPGNVTFAKWALASCNIMVGFAGHLAYFKVMDEMEKPEDFKWSLVSAGGVMFTLYMCCGIMIYVFVGSDVASVALSSAPSTLSKVAYGIATPTIIVAGVLAAYIASKRIELDFWTHRGKPEMVVDVGRWSTFTWRSIVVVSWTLALVLAIILPFFGPLLGLTGAIAATWIAMGLPAWFCMYTIREDVRERREQVHRDELKKESMWACFKFPSGARARTVALWVFCFTMVLTCVLFFGIGIYGSAVKIMEEVKHNDNGFSPFSCKSTIGGR